MYCTSTPKFLPTFHITARYLALSRNSITPPSKVSSSLPLCTYRALKRKIQLFFAFSFKFKPVTSSTQISNIFLSLQMLGHNKTRSSAYIIHPKNWEPSSKCVFGLADVEFDFFFTHSPCNMAINLNFDFIEPKRPVTTLMPLCPVSEIMQVFCPGQSFRFYSGGWNLGIVPNVWTSYFPSNPNFYGHNIHQRDERTDEPTGNLIITYLLT